MFDRVLNTSLYYYGANFANCVHWNLWLEIKPADSAIKNFQYILTMFLSILLNNVFTFLMTLMLLGFNCCSMNPMSALDEKIPLFAVLGL